MANLPDETVRTVFHLQRRLWELINLSTAAEWMMFEQFGETDETIPLPRGTQKRCRTVEKLLLSPLYFDVTGG